MRNLRVMAGIARQAALNSALTYAGLVLGFLNMVVLYPQVLAPGEVGLTRLVVSIAVIAAQVAQVGLEGAIIRHFPYAKAHPSVLGGLLRGILATASAGAALASLVLVLGHGLLTEWFGDKEGLYASHGLVVVPLVVAEVYFIVCRGLSRANHRSVLPVLAHEFILRVLQTLLIIVQAVTPMELRTFMLLFTGTFVVRTAVLAVDLLRSRLLTVKNAGRVPQRLIRSMWRYSMWTFATGFAAIVVGNVDLMLIAAILGKAGLAQVAFYSVAFLVASVIMVPTRALQQPAIPQLAEGWRRRDLSAIDRIYKASANVQWTVGVFLCSSVLACGRELFAVLPAEYAAGHGSLVVLCITNAIALSGGIGGGVLSTSKAYRFEAFLGFLLLGLNVVLDVLLVRAYGIQGAAWSTLISLVIVLLVRVGFLRQRFGLWPYTSGMLVVGVLGVVGGALSWYIPLGGVPGTGVGQIVLSAMVRTCLLALLFWPAVLFGGLSPHLNAILRGIGRRLQA